ncbi:MAG: hypothetical protein ACE5LU_25375 [Anaerolineae bacterium]
MSETVLIDQDIPVRDGMIRWELDTPALNQLASNFDYQQALSTSGTWWRWLLASAVRVRLNQRGPRPELFARSDESRSKNKCPR